MGCASSKNNIVHIPSTLPTTHDINKDTQKENHDVLVDKAEQYNETTTTIVEPINIKTSSHIEENKKSKFMEDIDRFIESHNDPNSFVNKVQTQFNVDKNEYNKQLKTFREDMILLEKGEMDYATMRSLYG